MSQTQFEKYQKKILNKKTIPYIKHLKKHKGSLIAKRIFDLIASTICIVVLSPFFLISVLLIKTSKGPVFYKQLRVGKNGKELYVLKLRTMVINADKSGEITVGEDDCRITPVGRFLRAINFDEFPQFFQVFSGSMSIMGVRPEVPHYVDFYSDEDFATLLMKPGLTSPVAIKYRHENALLQGSADPEKQYIEEILPQKMKLNCEYVKNFTFLYDLKILGKTFLIPFQKDELLEEKKNGNNE